MLKVNLRADPAQSNGSLVVDKAEGTRPHNNQGEQVLALHPSSRGALQIPLHPSMQVSDVSEILRLPILITVRPREAATHHYPLPFSLHLDALLLDAPNPWNYGSKLAPIPTLF
jgi:hypothetical protein